MIRVIHKYEIPPQGDFELNLPDSAHILCIQVQNDKPVMWVSLDEFAKRSVTKFKIVTTGSTYEYDNFIYIDTFQLLNGKHVGHVFEEFIKTND